MRDEILNYLESYDRARSLKEINDALRCNNDELIKELNNLVEEGIVHETKKCKYILMKYCKSLRTGTIDVAKNGYAFLIIDKNSEDIFISKDNLNDAINGDYVLADLFTRNGKVEGKVIKLLKRGVKRLVGEILYVKGKPTIILDDKKLDIEIKLENYFNNLVDGHKVIVELKEQLGPKKFKGLVTKIIGHKNDPDIDILSIACKYNIELEFSDEVMKEVEKIPSEVLDKDRIGRVDLTSEEIFTIDGDDTKDIDDAISIKEFSDHYELGVHIADVSYYVKRGTKLYDAAYERGTSSYLADRVLPMLPHELSNGICSLNPGVDRLAISVIMNIDLNGKILDYDIFPSVIKSRKQMTYKCVNKIIEEGIIPLGYEEYQDSLLKMQKLAHILRKRMIKNGYIEFEIPEAKIIQDDNGKCIDIVKREQHEGEMLIECFMIAANETVATHITNMDLPFIYRVHGVPKSEKIDDFLNLLKILHINIDTRGIDSSSQSMQKLLNELKDYKENEILSTLLLRSMQKAIYSPNNIGHFGLGLKNYTHFTSPIRRLPDTTVHELLRVYLFDKNINNNTIKYYNSILPELALHASEREYMESHIGEEYEGIITSVTNFGFFVQLDNLIEGLVHISSLDGYYTYVPELLALVGLDKKIKYQIGDGVKVKVVGASKENKTVDFEVIDGNSK